MTRCLSCGNPTVGDLCPECQARFASTGPQQPGPQQPGQPFGRQQPGPQHPGQPFGRRPGQGPEFIYRPAPPPAPPSAPPGYPPSAPQTSPQGWSPQAPAQPATPKPPRDKTTPVIVVGLAVVLLAGGIGTAMLLLSGGADSDLAANPAAPAPASTVFVTVEESEPAVVETPAATPSAPAVVPDAPAPAAPTTVAAQPPSSDPVGEAPAQQQEFVRYYPLFRGDQGYVVLALQELLSWRGVRTLADGDFGPATERSVRQWQVQNGLDATGIVDDTTWDSLVPRLTQGSQGEGVAVLQRLLGYRGYETVVDGDFGPETDATVRAFQAERGIPVDGLVGPVTWAALLA